MTRLLLVFVGLLAGIAHAQSFDWNRVRASCSSEMNAYDAVRGTGDTSSQAMRYLEKEAASPAKLRDLLERQRASLSDAYLMKTPAFRNSALMYVCAATAALNQLQNGSTQNAAAAPSCPSQYNAPGSSSGRDRPDLMASECLDRKNDQLRNNCNRKVSVNWCTNDYGTYGCGNNNNLGWSVLDPGDSTYLSAPQVYWFACALPARPTDVEYLPGRGLRAACTQ